MTTNRRDVLRGATGLAAAGAIGSVLAGGSPVHAAQGQGQGGGVSGAITGSIGDLGQFEVLAFSWGLSNSGTTHTGGGGGAGKVNIQDLSFTKYVDQLSPDLFLAIATGSHFPDASVSFVGKTGSVVTIEMEEVIVTSMSTGGSTGEGALTENVTINFAKVRFSVDAQSKHWDIPTNSEG